MSTGDTLILPDTYEDLIKELGEDVSKMTQFVVPVEEAEKELAIIAQSIKSSGKIVLVLGLPGVGKSTFVKSLTWRKHLLIPRITEVDASSLGTSQLLPSLYEKLREVVSRLPESSGTGTLMTVVINYLENLAGQDPENVRAFFRNVNGLLSANPLLIIWPVTEKNEAIAMLTHASAVSGTVFYPDKPILEFHGPPFDEFPVIAKNTISTLNPGRSFDDFQLNDDDFDELLSELKRRDASKRTAREYLRSVRQRWQNRTGEIERIKQKIPKPTEVWFVVCFPEAESVVSQFARKSPYDPNDAWDAFYLKFSEYIVGNTQKSADWNARRLQLALQGAFRTKVMFMPTNSIVSCVAAFGKANSVPQRLLIKMAEESPTSWLKESRAVEFLSSSPVVRQLRKEPAKLGMRRGGPAAYALEKARKPFAATSEFISRGGEGSDKPINRCLAQGLRVCLKVGEDLIAAEQAHPWLDGIRPDIVVEIDPDRIVCIEMFYTANKRPHVLADYVLKKMDRYMKQLDHYSK